MSEDPPAAVSVPLRRPATRSRPVFDAAFGFVLPSLCVVVDPAVFRGNVFGAPLLGAWTLGAYAFMGLATLVLGAWVATRRGALLAAGPLFAGAAVAFAIGAALLPFSIPMNFTGIGLLGFVPIGTGFVYLRRAQQALDAARARRGGLGVGAVALVAALGCVAVAVPAAAHLHVKRTTRAALSLVVSNPRREGDAVAILRRYAAVADRDELRSAYEAARVPAERVRLARAWREATGEVWLPPID